MGSSLTEWVHVVLTAYLTVGSILPRPLVYVYTSAAVILSWLIVGTCPLNIGMEYPLESFTEALLGSGGLQWFMRIFLINNLFASFRTGVTVNLLLLLIHTLKDSQRYYSTKAT